MEKQFKMVIELSKYLVVVKEFDTWEIARRELDLSRVYFPDSVITITRINNN